MVGKEPKCRFASAPAARDRKETEICCYGNCEALGVFSSFVYIFLQLTFLYTVSPQITSGIYFCKHEQIFVFFMGCINVCLVIDFIESEETLGY